MLPPGNRRQVFHWEKYWRSAGDSCIANEPPKNAHWNTPTVFGRILVTLTLALALNEAKARNIRPRAEVSRPRPENLASRPRPRPNNPVYNIIYSQVTHTDIRLTAVFQVSQIPPYFSFSVFSETVRPPWTDQIFSYSS